jgi:hypothetical protein
LSASTIFSRASDSKSTFHTHQQSPVTTNIVSKHRVNTMNVGKGLAYKMKKKKPYNLENSEYIFDFGNLIVILSFPHFCFVLSCTETIQPPRHTINICQIRNAFSPFSYVWCILTAQVQLRFLHSVMWLCAYTTRYVFA